MEATITMPPTEARAAKLAEALRKLADASPCAVFLPPEEAKPFSEAYAAARAALAEYEEDIRCQTIYEG